MPHAGDFKWNEPQLGIGVHVLGDFCTNKQNRKSVLGIHNLMAYTYLLATP
jgi:hypothetical protein